MLICFYNILFNNILLIRELVKIRENVKVSAHHDVNNSYHDVNYYFDYIMIYCNLCRTMSRWIEAMFLLLFKMTLHI